MLFATYFRIKHNIINSISYHQTNNSLLTLQEIKLHMRPLIIKQESNNSLQYENNSINLIRKFYYFH